MTNKHTPGPWEYEVHELSSGLSGIVYGAHGYAIADHLSEANASLIAAAPELLDALQSFVAAVDRAKGAPVQFYDGMSNSAITKARAAIVKATRAA